MPLTESEKQQLRASSERRVQDLERFAATASAITQVDFYETLSTPEQWARVQLAATVLGRWLEAVASHRPN